MAFRRRRHRRIPAQQGHQPDEDHGHPPHPVTVATSTSGTSWWTTVRSCGSRPGPTPGSSPWPCSSPCPRRWPSAWLPPAAPGWRRLAVGTAGVIFTIPSLALFALLVAPLGLGTAPAVAALALYSVLPVLRNTIVGLQEVPADAIEAARGMGMTERPGAVAGALAAGAAGGGRRRAGGGRDGGGHGHRRRALVAAGGLGDSIFAGLRYRRRDAGSGRHCWSSPVWPSPSTARWGRRAAACGGAGDPISRTPPSGTAPARPRSTACRWRCRRGRRACSSARRAAARPPPSRWSTGSWSRRRVGSSSTGTTSPATDPVHAAAGDRLRHPAGRAVPPPRRGRQRGHRPPAARAGTGAGSTAGSTSCSTSSGSTRRPTATAGPTSSPAGSASGSASPGPWPPTRPSC